METNPLQLDLPIEFEGCSPCQGNKVNTPEKHKRGKKPLLDKKKDYFCEEEEDAFRIYVETDDLELKNRIFEEKLHPAFTKMIESIIRRYHLFTPNEDFEDTFNDTISFMLTKINNFDFSKGKKLYSYCGTICKNYLILKRCQVMRSQKRDQSYEITYNESHPDERIDENNSEAIEFTDGLVSKMCDIVKDMVDNREKYMLTDNEVKIGNIMLYMFSNSSEFFQSRETRKFNKTQALYYIKENTFMTTKEIREAMKKYKLIYGEAKAEYIDKVNNTII